MNNKTNNTAKLILNSLLVFILLVLFGVRYFYVYTYIKDRLTDTSVKRHLFSDMRYHEDKMLIGFNEEQENRILEAFNVVIPKNDEDAYVYSFYFTKENKRMKFILEIDGVKDYDAFFQANTGRIKENGLLGKSWNEIGNTYLPMEAYYVTYYESFSYENNFLSDEDKEMMSALSALYDELKGEVPSGTKTDYTANLIKIIVVGLLYIFIFFFYNNYSS